MENIGKSPELILNTKVTSMLKSFINLELPILTTRQCIDRDPWDWRCVFAIRISFPLSGQRE